MTAPLLPCPSCARHVRSNEATCPFCASSLPQAFASAEAPEAFPRMSRAALVVFGAALTANAMACGPSLTQSNSGTAPVVVQQPSPPPADNGSTIIVVRPPISNPPPVVTPEPPAPAPAYGLPAPIANPSPRPRPPRDPGMPAARYGAPPPPEDPGTVHAMYGVPAPK